jgi:glyoxylase-like metal-dependent hydrolase (beta-lactamase superfamily II)
MASITRLADDLILIDTHYLNTPEAIGVYLLLGDQPALIETGPASTLNHVIDGVRAAGLDPHDLQRIAVTHIHLDHAGGAGTLVRRFPHLQVYVHPVGAPHLIDPSRLLVSAARLYGDDLHRLFGEVQPVPADHVHVLQDEETVQLGSRTLIALDTPGHARHHHAYLDQRTGDLFTGDVAGVSLPGSRYVRAPTPPPELDIPAWERSIRKILARHPKRLLLTHYGPRDWVEDLFDQLKERLHQGETAVRDAIRQGLDEPAITERLRTEAMGEIVRRDGPEAPARYEVIMPIRQSVIGLIRYVEKSAHKGLRD